MVLRFFGCPAKYSYVFFGLLLFCRILLLSVFLARSIFTGKVLYFFELRGFLLWLLWRLFVIRAVRFWSTFLGFGRYLSRWLCKFWKTFNSLLVYRYFKYTSNSGGGDDDFTNPTKRDTHPYCGWRKGHSAWRMRAMSQRANGERVSQIPGGRIGAADPGEKTNSAEKAADTGEKTNSADLFQFRCIGVKGCC